jgi:hypothetical protein
LSLAISEEKLHLLRPSELAYYDYALYGLRIRSDIKLTLDDVPVEGSADVELLAASRQQFADIAVQVELDQSTWIHHHELTDGRSFIRYDGLFEFVVAPLGNQILYRFLDSVHLESFQTYLLGRVFSFALVKMGYEPLHAATVVVDGRAVAFLGASTFGKSSLATCFVASGFPLLTDDTLRLEERDGRYVAFPGPPRLRLLPKIARLYLGGVSNGVVMNPHEKDARAPKLVFCLSPSLSYPEVAPLGAIYVLTKPRRVHRKQRIEISSLTPLQAFMNVVSFTHNDGLTSSDRLTRQLEAARRLIDSVTIRSLSYPRILASLDEVKDAILEDLKHYGTSV